MQNATCNDMRQQGAFDGATVHLGDDVLHGTAVSTTITET
jgi:hypothetical protein